MAALRDIARDFAAEIRDGIGWTIVYRTGRSWNALTIWSDIWNGEWETDDLNDAIGILKADPDTKSDNAEMVVFVDELGESAVIMGLRVWVPTEAYWATKWRLNQRIKEEFDANGIAIPYNQLEVYVHPRK